MIVFNIDVMLARRKMSLTELSHRVGITMANLSILKTGKARAVRVDTLNKLCRALDCQPGDLLEYRPGPEDDNALRNNPVANITICCQIGEQYGPLQSQ